MSATTTRPAWLNILLWFGPVLLFGGGLFLCDGAWQIGREYLQGTKWPAANAQIETCSIYESWNHAGTPKTKVTLSKSSYVRCKLRYQAEGVEKENTVKIGDAVSTYDNHRPFLTSKLTITGMQEWLRRHPSGSFLAIHYDPSNPENLSFAGEDRDLRAATPEDRLWFGCLTCAGGLAIVVLARRARR